MRGGRQIDDIAPRNGVRTAQFTPRAGALS